VKYRFASVCVDSDARIVSNDAGTVRLRRKAFDLLLLLLECRPRAVSKEQVHARLWPDTFVTESSLQSLIHEIRQAIDDRTSRRSCVSVVHGIGYRFDGDVEVSDAQPARDARTGPAAWLLGEPSPVALDWGENIVGRAVDGVTGIQAPSVSRRHARIVIGDSASIEDLGSKNGTWLEGQRLTTSRPLADGDVVRLGSVSFTFRLARHPRSTESADGPEPGAS
jgi:DNA-binding winged helix-turn-helix (wHTH) protein